MAMVAAIDSDSCRQQAFAGIYCVPLGIFVIDIQIILWYFPILRSVLTTTEGASKDNNKSSRTEAVAEV